MFYQSLVGSPDHSNMSVLKLALELVGIHDLLLLARSSAVVGC